MPRTTSKAALAAIAEENALFLRHLRLSGNAALAARMAKRPPATFAGRRRASFDFDAACVAALAFARAALKKAGGASAPRGDAHAGGDEPMVATGGEYAVGIARGRVLQVRRARAGRVTQAGERAFLEALAATANIRLAADAVGVQPGAFYRRRAQSPEFARAMQEALTVGYEAVEFALVGAALRTLAPGGGDADAPAPVEPGARMSVDQAMALIAQRARTMAIGERRVNSEFKRMPTPEETDALLAKRLDALYRSRGYGAS